MASRLETLLVAFADFLASPAVLQRHGRRALAEGGSVPRITHVGMGGEIVPPDMVGEGLLIDFNTGAQTRDRIIRVRQFNTLMVVHGQDEEQAETLFHNAVAAWFAACSGSVEFSAEEWPDQQEGADGVERRGNQIQCTVTIYIPIYQAPKPLTFLSNGWTEDGLFTTGILYGTGNNPGTYGPQYTYKPGEIVC